MNEEFFLFFKIFILLFIDDDLSILERLYFDFIMNDSLFYKMEVGVGVVVVVKGK